MTSRNFGTGRPGSEAYRSFGTCRRDLRRSNDRSSVDSTGNPAEVPSREYRRTGDMDAEHPTNRLSGDWRKPARSTNDGSIRSMDTYAEASRDTSAPHGWGSAHSVNPQAEIQKTGPGSKDNRANSSSNTHPGTRKKCLVAKARRPGDLFTPETTDTALSFGATVRGWGGSRAKDSSFEPLTNSLGLSGGTTSTSEDNGTIRSTNSGPGRTSFNQSNRKSIEGPIKSLAQLTTEFSSEHKNQDEDDTVPEQVHTAPTDHGLSFETTLAGLGLPSSTTRISWAELAEQESPNGTAIVEVDESRPSALPSNRISSAEKVDTEGTSTDAVEVDSDTADPHSSSSADESSSAEQADAETSYGSDTSSDKTAEFPPFYTEENPTGRMPRLATGRPTRVVKSKAEIFDDGEGHGCLIDMDTIIEEEEGSETGHRGKRKGPDRGLEVEEVAADPFQRRRMDFDWKTEIQTNGRRDEVKEAKTVERLLDQLKCQKAPVAVPVRKRRYSLPLALEDDEQVCKEAQQYEIRHE